MGNESPYKGKTGFRRLFAAVGYSMDGLVSAWTLEAAFRQLCVVAAIGVGIALYLPLQGWPRALIVLTHLIGLIVELINSAIEAAVDHTSLAHHPLAKRAKDLGSAAQFLSLMALLLIWWFALVDIFGAMK